jgi:ubiquinone/menaquinone biosynthesis C-methylase UbiE
LNIVYQLSTNAWTGFGFELMEMIEEYSPKRVCDIGGGANPSLPLEFIREKKIKYTLLDISQEELQKAPADYEKVHTDICDPRTASNGPFDLIFSKMVLEHIQDAKAFHTNVFQMLSPGGLAYHYFPTLFALPFLVNKITPEPLSNFLLDVFAPRDHVQMKKFPAVYHWTFGPTPPQIARLTNIGYQILEYRGFFGHIYFNKIPGLHNLHHQFAEFLVNHPNPYLTSFAYVLMQKPI